MHFIFLGSYVVNMTQINVSLSESVQSVKHKKDSKFCERTQGMDSII